MFQTNIAEKIKTHFMFRDFSLPKNGTVCKIIWKNVVERDRQQVKIIIRRMRIACWITKARIWYDMIYLLTAIRLPPGGSSTVHIYTQTIHRTTQLTQTIHRTTQLIWEEFRPCPVFARYTLEFALQLRKKHGKTSVRVVGECQLARWKQNIQNTKQ